MLEELREVGHYVTSITLALDLWQRNHKFEANSSCVACPLPQQASSKILTPNERMRRKTFRVPSPYPQFDSVVSVSHRLKLLNGKFQK